MRLLVVTNAPTLEEDGEFVAYAPYVKEMDIWFKNVKEVGILSPTNYPESIFSKKFDFQQIKLFKLPFLTFRSFAKAFYNFLLCPIIFFQFCRAFLWADHLHLRCPGNVGLLACICQIFIPSKPKSAKYAGNWDPEAKQPWSYRLQKWILRNTFLTRNMQVLVYGEWPEQTKNVVPFFTASFSEEEKAEVREKTFSRPFTFLFVGNLVEGKRPLEAVKLVQELIVNRRGASREISARLEIYGNGPERENLEAYVRENQLDQYVIFKGSRPLEELKEAYHKAHFVILPSRSEGWPKAIAEGMFFGCIPIATPVSCVPWMLNYGSRGILLDEYKSQETRVKKLDLFSGNIEKVELLLQDQKEMKRMSEVAKEWSQQYTLERFDSAIKEVLLNGNREVTVTNRQLSPAPFRDGAKRGKRKE